LNVDWAGKCDIDLDGSMIPTLVSLFRKCFGSPGANSTTRESKALPFMADFPFFWAH
jgi:hypothetical protein